MLFIFFKKFVFFTNTPLRRALSVYPRIFFEHTIYKNKNWQNMNLVMQEMQGKRSTPQYIFGRTIYILYNHIKYNIIIIIITYVKVAVREMLGKRSAPSVGDKVVFEQPKLLLL